VAKRKPSSAKSQPAFQLPDRLFQSHARRTRPLAHVRRLAEHDAYHLDDEQVAQYTIFVDTLKVSATNFDIDSATQQQLFSNGQRAAEEFFRSWPAPRPASPAAS
jgi:hypothetical protein